MQSRSAPVLRGEHINFLSARSATTPFSFGLARNDCFRQPAPWKHKDARQALSSYQLR